MRSTDGLQGNLLSHGIYNIRHSQGHVREINAELRRRGLLRIP
jgi:hypothetical protein